MKKIFILIGVFLFSFMGLSFACDSCGCTLARMSDHAENEGSFKPWFFDLTFEQQNWDVKDPREAHTLHHQGHEFHDKTHEEFYHFTFGANPSERFTLLAEIPYVVRGSLDIHHHATLGRKEQSEGIGDLTVTGVYKILVKNSDFLGISGGIKFPTGATKEEDLYGDIFEPELQPGSGSYDYPVGVVYRYTIQPVILSGNVSYVIKTEGSQDFQYGDLLFASMNADVVINPQSKSFKTKVGCHLSVHHSQKDMSLGIKSDDSGETTLFMGPGLSVEASDNLSIFGNIQFPVHQTTGGVHQKLDFIWTAGAKVAW